MNHLALIRYEVTEVLYLCKNEKGEKPLAEQCAYCVKCKGD